MYAGFLYISLAGAEDGVKLDKLVLKNSQSTPVDIGEEATNLCTPALTTGVTNNLTTQGYVLKQNYPNPAYGVNTSISFEIPTRTFVSLKVINSKGVEIQELAGKEFNSGEHTVVFNPDKILPAGTYYYKIKAGDFSATKEMILFSK